MGLTALRNRRGIQAKPAVEAPGTGKAQAYPDYHPGGFGPNVFQNNNLMQALQGRPEGGAPSAEAMAPRYQELLKAGVDPDVVAKRAAAFKSGQLPGQVGLSGQTPGINPIANDLTMNNRGNLPPGANPYGGGPLSKPAQRPSGRFPVNPNDRGPRPLPAGEPPITGPGGVQSMNGGGLQSGPLLPNGQPMQNIKPMEPVQGGTLNPLPAQIGGFLSPGAWGALGGGAPLLPNGQPMGGGDPLPYGNDAQARQIPGPAPMQNMNGGGLQSGRPDAGSGYMTPMNGGGLQSGPLLPNGQPMAPTGQPPVSVDPQQARNAAVARGIAGRMAGGAFNV